MEQNQSQDFLLADDPTLEQRWQALCLNVQIWYERLARASDDLIYRAEGIMGTSDMITISSLDERSAGDQIDCMLNWYRGLSSFKGAICWYLGPTPPRDLDAQLFARGFAPNWQPHWMWCELHHLQRNVTLPAGYTLCVVEEKINRQVADVPYYMAEDAEILANLRYTCPRHVWQLVVLQGQQIVGRCLLNVTTGERGVAGLFNMGVAPSARRQGIGTALTQAACELARQQGCRHVVLNATAMGESIYRRVGFQSMGYGHTWYLRAQALSAPEPARTQVTFLEAVGRGDIETLNQISGDLAEYVVQVAGANGLTPLDIAVRCQQPAAANWLVEHGASLDLLSAWDLGWRERIPTLLAEHPELVNLRKGDWQATPLHRAAERNAIELAQLLLSVPNDLTIKDSVFNSTALGWAHHFGRTEIIALIEQHRSSHASL